MVGKILITGIIVFGLYIFVVILALDHLFSKDGNEDVEIDEILNNK